MKQNVIKRYAVSHRSGCEIWAPKIFNTIKESTDYIDEKLAEYVRNYVCENYGAESTEYFELSDLNINDQVAWGEENDLICNMSFIGYCDWEEFDYNEIEIPLTKKESLILQKNNINDSMSQSDRCELFGQLIDVIEDWLEKKGITPNDIPNPDREDDDSAIIYGEDYDYLADKFSEIIGIDRDNMDELYEERE